MLTITRRMNDMFFNYLHNGYLIWNVSSFCRCRPLSLKKQSWNVFGSWMLSLATEIDEYARHRKTRGWAKTELTVLISLKSKQQLSPCVCVCVPVLFRDRFEKPEAYNAHYGFLSCFHERIFRLKVLPIEFTSCPEVWHACMPQ